MLIPLSSKLSDMLDMYLCIDQCLVQKTDLEYKEEEVLT